MKSSYPATSLYFSSRIQWKWLMLNSLEVPRTSRLQGGSPDQVDVLIAQNVTILEVNHKAIGGQEIRAEDGLLDHLEFPPVLPALKL